MRNDTVVPFATKLLKLENSVQIMILQGLGVQEEHINDSTRTWNP
jgi:hypothetical protein